MIGGSPLIDPDRHLDILEHEGGLLAAATTTGANHDRPVPGCPGLTLGETARHTGSVYRTALAWIRTGDRPTAWQRQPFPDQTVGDYVRDGLRSLLGELATHSPAAPCATWCTAQQHYGFWRRRMAHESTIHRIDAQSAGGQEVTAVDPEVAVDGIDEVMDLWFSYRLTSMGVTATREGTVSVRTADRVWVATFGPRETTARRATADTPADAVVTADPTELYLWLWGRRAVFDRAVRLDGDLDASAQLWALLRLATR